MMTWVVTVVLLQFVVFSGYVRSVACIEHSY